MSNVPSHSRTRTTHRHGESAGGSRRSHQHSGYLPPLESAAEVYEQVSIDEAGQVTSGQIAPGALHNPALFAQTIRPVVIVTVNPTLPDTSYPEGSFIYNITDAPPRLYKNEAEAWVAAIGPDDIQANSITAGQIAAGAVSTDELAVGARLTGEVANEAGATPGVFIDSTGILIRDGKLTLEDEFGLTTLEASGFSGSWGDFIATGLYNGGFQQGTTGVVANGRTSDLPYWTVSQETGSPIISLGNGYVSVKFSAVNNKAKLVSDLVPIGTGRPINYGAVIADPTFDLVPGTKLNLYVGIEFTNDGVSWFTYEVSELAVDNFTMFPIWGIEDALTAIARYARLYIIVEEVVGHSALNEVFINSAWIRTVPSLTDSQDVRFRMNIRGDGASGSNMLSIWNDNKLSFGGDDETAADAALGSGGAGVLAVDDGSGNDTATLQVNKLDITGTVTAPVTRAIALMADQRGGLLSGTAVTLGAGNDVIGAVALADAATQGLYWEGLMPLDFDTSEPVSIQPIWGPGSTDAAAHTVRWTARILGRGAGQDVTGAGSDTTFTGSSAARTANQLVYDTITDLTETTLVAGVAFKLSVRRIGADAADTYVGVVNLIGVILRYTATR